jgi:hypothetical protein
MEPLARLARPARIVEADGAAVVPIMPVTVSTPPRRLLRCCRPAVSLQYMVPVL